MECEVRLITPQDASILLASNTGNRKLNSSHVCFFEEQLKRGEMQLTHQGIAISASGRLLDGQHRLTAIVKTGISATMLVTTGLPDKTFSVLDTGYARTAADVLSIGGAKHVSTTAAAIRLFLFYKHIPGNVWVGRVAKSKATTSAIKAEYERDQEGWSWASRVAGANNLKKIVIPGTAACLLYLATKESGYTREYASAFISSLSVGDNLSAGNPILAYRNKTLASDPGFFPQSRLADYIKLFNACATGQQLKIFKSQAYPPMPSLIHASESIHENAAS